MTSPDIDNRTKEACDGLGTLFSAMGSDFSMVNLDFGINFDWSKPKCELPHNMTKTKASEWLMNATEFQLQEFDNNCNNCNTDQNCTDILSGKNWTLI